jgi:hypothetical protein
MPAIARGDRLKPELQRGDRLKPELQHEHRPLSSNEKRGRLKVFVHVELQVDRSRLDTRLTGC